MTQCLQERMRNFLELNIQTDVTFIVQGERINAHKAIVSSHEGLLMQYVNGGEDTIEIREEINASVFRNILK